MKKFLLILLALIMCFSLCACGESIQLKVDKELNGTTWSTPSGGASPFKTVYDFVDDTKCYIDSYYYHSDSGFEISYVTYCTYSVISDSEIQIVQHTRKRTSDVDFSPLPEDEDKICTLNYTYENGVLKIYHKETVELIELNSYDLR